MLEVNHSARQAHVDLLLAAYRNDFKVEHYGQECRVVSHKLWLDSKEVFNYAFVLSNGSNVIIRMTE